SDFSLMDEFILATQTDLIEAHSQNSASSASSESTTLILSDDIRIEVTPLGKATFSSGIEPATARRMHQDLWRALSAMHLQTPLHLLYLSVPYEQVEDFEHIDWDIFLREVSEHLFFLKFVNTG